MTDPVLFDDFEPPTLEPAEILSAGRRRTLRQKQHIEAGFHPLTQTRTHPELGTCGGCALRSIEFGYPKCTLGADIPNRKAGPYMTHGAATDCRAWWPACSHYQAKDSAK